MDTPGAFFWLLLAAMVGYFAYNAFRRGGVKAALFNASISSTVGEIEMTEYRLVSQRLKVHSLERDGQPLVGIEVVSKSVGSYEMLPLVLTRAQATQLSALLQQAQK